MKDSTATLIVALYPDRGLAEEDLEVLEAEPMDGELEIVDVALVSRDEHGRVRVSNRPRRAHRRGHPGPRRNRMILDSRRRMLRRDLRDLGENLEDSSAAIIAVGRGTGAEKLSAVLHCSDLMVNRLTHQDLAFRQLIADHARHSSSYATIRG